MPKTLLVQLANRGVMPYCAGLLDHCARGALVELRAPVPEVSSTSWSTFLTGVNPGRHGIYGFIDLKRFSYEFYFPNLKYLATPCLWDIAERAGKRTLCLNVPTTYPAKAINGVLISGFPAVDLKKSFYPPGLAEEFAEYYKLDIEVGDVATNPEGVLRRIEESLRARLRVFTTLMEREDWDLAVAVFTETDRLQHFFWHSLPDSSHPLHAQVLDIYSLVDQCIAALASRVDDSDGLFLVSDHGFATIKAQIYMNAWLRHKGYLSLAADASSFACLDERTKAFALDPGRIFIHRKKQFPRGGVEDNEAADLMQKLRSELRELTWDAPSARVGTAGEGEPILQNVFLKEEIYSGPLRERAADLIAVAATGFNLRGAWKHDALVGHDSLTGAHTRGNAIFYYRDGLGCTKADMQDVAPTVLSALGIDCGNFQFDGHDLSSPMVSRKCSMF